MAGLVLIADDDSNTLDCLADMVKEAGFRVSAVTSGQHAVERFWEEQADVVFLDFKMPDISGIEAMMEIKEMRPGVPIFIMSGQGDIPTAVSAMKRGACDFIVKPMKFDMLISTLKNAVDASKSDVPAETEKPFDSKVHEILSEREIEILVLTAKGHSGTIIGSLLNISRRTVETYRKRIMKKFKLRNKTDVVRFAEKHSFIPDEK